MKIATIIILVLSFPSLLHAQGIKSTPPKLFPIEVKGKFGFINNSGHIIVKPRFDNAWGFSEGLAPVLVGDNWGFIDETGKMVIKPQFVSAWPFVEGLSVVGVLLKTSREDGRFAVARYIDRTGQFAFKAQFNYAFDFSNGMARVQTEDDRDGYVDRTGKVIFLSDNNDEDFSDGLVAFSSGDKTGYLNKRGQVAVSPIFNYGKRFTESLACVKAKGKAGFIDTSGHAVIAFRFESCKEFSEGLAAVMVGGKWGYIDKSGKMIIEPQFAEAEQFSEDAAVVRIAQESELSKQEERYKEGDNIVSVKSGKFGVIDRNGKMVLPAQFVQIGKFSGGLAWVNLGEKYIVHGDVDKWGYINKTGRYVWKSFL